MRLTEQANMFNTIQGEGVNVGTPATFLRLQGCDSRCSWCDTKNSLEVKGGVEVDLHDIAQQLRLLMGEPPVKMLVITGGNPMLQQDEIVKLHDMLPPCRVTIETQGTVMPRHGMVGRANVMWSLSPKLEFQDPKSVLQNWEAAVQYTRVYPKVVVTPETIAQAMELAWWHSERTLASSHLQFRPLVLQPEFSGGSRLMRDLVAAVGKSDLTNVRVIPQVHKLVGVL